jgi:hypothetical protein
VTLRMTPALGGWELRAAFPQAYVGWGHPHLESPGQCYLLISSLGQNSQETSRYILGLLGASHTSAFFLARDTAVSIMDH